jgi:hypothetical protein
MASPLMAPGFMADTLPYWFGKWQAESGMKVQP